MDYISEIFTFIINWFVNVSNGFFNITLYPSFTIGSIVALFIVFVILGSVWRLL